MYDIGMSKDFPEELRGELVSSLQEVQRHLAEKREAEKQDQAERQTVEQGGSVEREVEPDDTEREGQPTIDEGQQSRAGIRVGGSIQYNLPNILTAAEDEDLQEREGALRVPDPAKPRAGPGGLRRARKIDDTVDDIIQRQQRALKAAIELAEEQGHFEEAKLMREKQITETPSVFSDVMAANVEQERKRTRRT